MARDSLSSHSRNDYTHNKLGQRRQLAWRMWGNGMRIATTPMPVPLPVYRLPLPIVSDVYESPEEDDEDDVYELPRPNNESIH